ncbi:MAG: hypothetical protein WB974_04965, partial [Acidobacteriaceae bacterium]
MRRTQLFFFPGMGLLVACLLMGAARPQSDSGSDAAQHKTHTAARKAESHKAGHSETQHTAAHRTAGHHRSLPSNAHTSH